MREFFVTPGGKAADDDAPFAAMLEAHPDWIVLSLNAGRQGKFTAHKATCPTISYDLEAFGHEKRSPKICFESWTELTKWLDGRPELKAKGLNRFCPQCH